MAAGSVWRICSTPIYLHNKFFVHMSIPPFAVRLMIKGVEI